MGGDFQADGMPFQSGPGPDSVAPSRGSSQPGGAGAGSQYPLLWKNVPSYVASGRSVADVGKLRTFSGGHDCWVVNVHLSSSIRAFFNSPFYRNGLPVGGLRPLSCLELFHVDSRFFESFGDRLIVGRYLGINFTVERPSSPPY